MARRVVVRSGMVRGRTDKRKTTWVAGATSAGLTVLASASSVLDQTLIGSTAGAPFTIIRTRGLFYAESDQVAANEHPNGAFGFALVRDPAAAAGIISIPTPLTEQDDESWFVWQAYQAAYHVDAAGSTASPHRIEFDSKAQRKVQEGDTMVVVVQNSGSGHGIEFSINFRMLIMLH